MFADLLRTAWPAARPDFDAVEWVLDGGGRHLVLDRVPVDRLFCILEVGAFLGSSVRQWLSASPLVSVVAVDPWQDDDFWPAYARSHGRDAVASQFERADGIYQTFLSSLWGVRDRVLPVRAKSPAALYELAKHGVVPDLVYLDNDKGGDELEIIHKLWPHAIITGDDWTWGMSDGYPIREPVRRFAKRHGYRVVASLSTWALTDRRLTVRERRHNIESHARDGARALRRLRQRKTIQTG